MSTHIFIKAKEMLLKPHDQPYIKHLESIAAADVATIQRKDAEYAGSWLKRGGVGAAMNLMRKLDRIEPQLAGAGWDVFKAIADDPRPEGILDDLRDLRRYLFLVEAAATERGLLAKPFSDPGNPANGLITADGHHHYKFTDDADVVLVTHCHDQKLPLAFHWNTKRSGTCNTCKLPVVLSEFNPAPRS